MTHDLSFLMSFGLVALGCLFLIFIWGSMLLVHPRPPGRWGDNYHILTLALTLGATGSLLLFANRAIDSFFNGVWSTPEVWDARSFIILSGAGLLFCSNSLLILVSDLNKKGTGRARMGPVYLFCCLLWALFSWWSVGQGLLPVVEASR